LILTGLTAQDTPSSTERLRGILGRQGRARAALLAAAGLAAAAIVAAVVAAAPGPASQRPAPGGRSAVPATTAARARMVTIDNAALDGQPAAAVLAKLRRAGLHPRLAELPDGSQPPGSVITVAPAGRVPLGSPVTVTAATAPPGHKHHHHHGGNGD
jgi:hypothetical protein